MKPCEQNRKQIGWLAMGALDHQQAQSLRLHLADCEGCRGYLEQLTGVIQRLSAAEYTGNIAVSDAFHRRLAARLSAPERASVLETTFALLRAHALGWRIALTLLAVTGVTIGGFFLLTRNAHISPREPARIQSVPVADQEPSLPPTIANYQIVASQSLEEFEALLTRQASHVSSSGPLYTASALALETAAD